MSAAFSPSIEFTSLDRLLEGDDPAASLDFLIDRFLDAKEYGLLFEARLMRKRFELGLPLIQTDSVTRDDYQQAVMDAAREAGGLFLADGNIERAWPYFRAIGEPGRVAEAIGRMQAGDNADAVISIAFQEGVHPLKGLELILEKHGMCRAITSFGMVAVEKDRDRCIALLARHLHAEIVSRMSRVIQEQEGKATESASLIELMNGRDWLFGEWDYYVDTSHLLSVIPYGVEITDPDILRLFYELCEYGRRLSPQFQSAGVPPFENQCVAYGHYVQALLGNDVEEHVDYFRRQAAECDPEIAGDAPARALVKLLVSLNRPGEALDVLLERVEEDAPYGAPVPSALQLCYRAGDFERMKEIARERHDLLSYVASSIMGARA